MQQLFWLLFFLTPLAMTPINSELFEFNKIILVYAFTILIGSMWVIRGIRERRVIFKRTPLDPFLLIFFTTQLVASIFSIDRHTSVWGYYGRWNGGLLSIFCYLTLYWAYVSNMTKNHTLAAIRYTLISALFVSLYGIAQHFGLDKNLWVQDVQSRVFSTLGQPNWLAAYLVAILPLTIINYELPITNFKKLTLNALLLTISLLCLFFTKSRSGFLGLGVAIAGYLFFEKKYKILGILGLLGLLGFLGWVTKNNSPSTSSVSKSTDIRYVVWQGAIDIGRHYPLLGTGPETFAYSYYWHRPREHNDLSEWDFLYNKAHNEYLNYFATTGVIGLLGYFGLIVGAALAAARLIGRARASLAPTQTALFLGWTTILVTNFFGFSVVVTSLFFFLLPAMIWVLNQNEDTQGGPMATQSGRDKSRPYNIKQYLGFLLIGILTVNCLRLTVNYWLADFHYANGVKLNRQQNFEMAYRELVTAIKTKDEPTYRDEIAWSAANLSVIATSQQQNDLAKKLAQLADSQSLLALHTSPYQLNFWKTRARIGGRLSLVDPKSGKIMAQEALEQAAKLAPTDAKVQYHLGILTGDKKYLEEALRLKPNYVEVQQALEKW